MTPWLLIKKERADEEQRREFLEEIDLMKQVGKHQNVLSFLGCWTTTEPFLLMLEYVAHGDLLQWLKRKRVQVILINNNNNDNNINNNKHRKHHSLIS